MRIIAFLALLLAAGCQISTVSTSRPDSRPQAPAPPPNSPAVQMFRGVVEQVGPVAVRTCRAQDPNMNCNFQVLLDSRPDLPVNAFQTLDRSGRPIIVFTRALVEDARNPDELALVLGHEAAHHIRGHIPKSQRRATEGALVGTAIAAVLGLDSAGTETIQRQGAFVGARRFSKEFELEADALGTVIAARAGYDPLLGAQFFNRIPDPGDTFLGTHPPNDERIRTVRRAAAGL